MTDESTDTGDSNVDQAAPGQCSSLCPECKLPDPPGVDQCVLAGGHWIDGGSDHQCGAGHVFTYPRGTGYTTADDDE